VSDTTANTAPARTTTVVFVTAEGLPDAWVNGNDVEVNITGYGRPVEATIMIPLDEARAWAADLYAAVTIACREHTGDGLSDYELASMPDPGRLIFERLAEHWTD
jgi:hypothetical protein